MAKFTQQAIESEQLRKKFGDEQSIEVALAGLEGVEGKDAEQERKFLQRRLDHLTEQTRRRAEMDQLLPEDVVKGIPR